MRARLIPALALALAAPAAAQVDVERRTFTFLRDDLVIDVVADGPGTLRLVRAGHGAIQVAGRADRALLDFGAPDRPGDPLRLSALGRGGVDWLVTVPPHVRVQVRTPGSAYVRSVTAANVQTWRWRGAAPVRRAASRSRHAPVPPAFAFTDRSVPDTVVIESPALLERLVVRVEGDTFGVAGSDRLVVRRQSESRLELAPGGDRPFDLVVVLPGAIPPPVLLVSGRSLLATRDGMIDTGCEAVSIVRTAGGTTLTFTPVEGMLQC